MKKLVIFLFTAILSMGAVTEFSNTVYAGDYGIRIQDQADLLTAEEHQALVEIIKNFEYTFDAVILTVDSLDGKTPEAYAKDFYKEHYFGEDGIIFLISIADSDWRIETFGFGDVAFTDYGLDYMEDSILSDLSEGNYYASFSKFLNLVDDFVSEAKEGAPIDTNNIVFNKNKAMLIATAVAAVIAIIVIAIMASQMNTKKPQDLAHQYVNRENVMLTERKDVFLYRTVTKSPKPKSSSSSGGGGGRRGGGRGGKF